jgi:hypothetical protein
MQKTPESALRLLDRLVGNWTTEATHPLVPGTVVHGTATIEWLEGQSFLILRSASDHPDFPDAISILGFMDADRIPEGADEHTAAAESSQLRMHYFDSRGVFRVYETEISDKEWRWRRIVPGFSQKFVGTFTDDDSTIVGRSQLRRDDLHWEDDLQITYRRK